MNPFANIIQTLLGGPQAAGSAVTGFDPATGMAMPQNPPMPPPRPDAATVDALAAQQPKGRVLAVIDPSRVQQQQREAENQGLFQQLAGSLTGGGLTADGRGRSKGGAFAHGLASGLNAQGATAAQRRKDALAERKWAEEMGLKTRKQDTDEKYWNHRMGLDNRTQAWRETPDAPGAGNSDINFWRERQQYLTRRQQQLNTLGLTGAGRGQLSTARLADAERRMAEWDAANPQPQRQQSAPAQGQPTPLPGATPPNPAAPNPAASGAPAPAQAAPAPAQPAAPRPAGAPAQPRSRAEYDALPSGAPFLDPNGVRRIKP
jgi:hypothetical protein